MTRSGAAPLRACPRQSELDRLTVARPQHDPLPEHARVAFHVLADAELDGDRVRPARLRQQTADVAAAMPGLTLRACITIGWNRSSGRRWLAASGGA